MSANWFYVDQNRNSIGPATIESLSEKFRSGVITGQTLIWDGDTVTEWTKIDSAPQIKAKFSAPVSPVPARPPPPGRPPVGPPRGSPLNRGPLPQPSTKASTSSSAEFNASPLSPLAPLSATPAPRAAPAQKPASRAAGPNMNDLLSQIKSNPALKRVSVAAEPGRAVQSPAPVRGGAANAGVSPASRPVSAAPSMNNLLSGIKSKPALKKVDVAAEPVAAGRSPMPSGRSGRGAGQMSLQSEMATMLKTRQQKPTGLTPPERVVTSKPPEPAAHPSTPKNVGALNGHRNPLPRAKTSYSPSKNSNSANSKILPNSSTNGGAQWRPLSAKSVLDTGRPVSKAEIFRKITNLSEGDPALMAINKLLMAI